MTAAALTKIVAKGHDAVFGLLNELFDRSAKVVLLVLRYGQLHVVSGSGKGDEDDLVLNMADSLSAVCQRLDLDGFRCSGLQLSDPRMCLALVIGCLEDFIGSQSITESPPRHVRVALAVGRPRAEARVGRTFSTP